MDPLAAYGNAGEAAGGVPRAFFGWFAAALQSLTVLAVQSALLFAWCGKSTEKRSAMAIQHRISYSRLAIHNLR